MNMKKFVLNSLLLAIGALLHQITPPLVLGMKPDFSLVMLFIVILYNEDFKSCITAGLVIGIFSALTTGFPAGQLPNIIDKIITTTIVYFSMRAFAGKAKEQILMMIIIALGTLISGIVFLSSAAFIAGLPGSFNVLLVTIVLPAALINTVVGMVLYNAVRISIKRSNYKID
ncbi:Tryptophan transporter TrpP [Proteiniborus ethanoligenes]|uniref:Tryptophan transporter TrpP n=1 Tax=Proteiniborus ethanoligenes TaxID=415015 RepID=A0A1H3SBZ1_9FIRM|nr:tryptophan transporter [Proteiniborus ethanoligenes]TAH62673.1 MAG: tryptophan transporter [Gottschalkiaceae bacterium]SDZ35536.1 Tryptophan transporter TrpP [Proteiniborus ethanoligenes]